jgi:hypothetical protein
MSQQLLQLIKSLTRTEKRYIHLNLKTFSYDENSNKLLQDFLTLEKKASLKRTNSPVKSETNSTRVYYRILDALFLLYKEQLYENENDNRLIKRSQVLFHKGFYQEGVKQLNKVIYKGFSYSYLLRIEAIELKIKAAIKFVDVDYLNSDFENDKKLLSEFSRYYFNQVEFESMWAIIKVESTTNYFFGNNSAFQEKYKNLLADEDNALSPNAKIYFNQINAFLAMKSGDPNVAYIYTQRTHDIFELYPEIRENNYNEYLKANRNLCIVLMHQKRFNEAQDLIDGISNSIELQSKRRAASLKNDIFTLTVLLNIDIIISSGSITENAYRLKEFEDRLKEYDEHIATDEKATCHYYISVMHLSLSNFRKALKFINTAISLSGAVRKDVHHLSLMAELVIHYNLGNTDLLFSRLTSYKRVVEKGEPVFSFEKKLPKLLSDAFNNPTQIKYFNTLFGEVKQSLTEENKTVYQPFITLFNLKPL